MTLFVLYREDSKQKFALLEALKRAAELAKTIGRHFMRGKDGFPTSRSSAGSAELIGTLLHSLSVASVLRLNTGKQKTLTPSGAIPLKAPKTLAVERALLTQEPT